MTPAKEDWALIGALLMAIISMAWTLIDRAFERKRRRRKR